MLRCGHPDAPTNRYKDGRCKICQRARVNQNRANIDQLKALLDELSERVTLLESERVT